MIWLTDPWGGRGAYTGPVLSARDDLPARPRRIVVAGVSGTGKTTLVAQIATAVDAPHTEIDALYHGPGWTPREGFLEDVRALTRAEAWTTEWQYGIARPILSERADLLVWLDLPFLTVTLPRVVRRTVRRRLHRIELWNGNVEPPLHTILTDRQHIIRWAFATRATYGPLVSRLESERPDLPIVRLRSTSEVRTWLSGPLVHAARAAHS